MQYQTQKEVLHNQEYSLMWNQAVTQTHVVLHTTTVLSLASSQKDLRTQEVGNTHRLVEQVTQLSVGTQAVLVASSQAFVAQANFRTHTASDHFA